MQDEKNKNICILSDIFKSATGQQFPEAELTKLVKKCGYELVKKYFDNAKRFTYTKNVVGFFMKAIQEGYEIPAKPDRRRESPLNMTNFKQRDLTGENWEQYYENFKENRKFLKGYLKKTIFSYALFLMLRQVLRDF